MEDALFMEEDGQKENQSIYHQFTIPLLEGHIQWQ